MSNLNKTSLSVKKSKRGLSLSLQKKNNNKIQNEQNKSFFKHINGKDTNQCHNTSIKKNKIKFAQSYQNYQSGSKFNKQKFFKITDQDIKLGGEKKPKIYERKVMTISNQNNFSQYHSNYQSNYKPTYNFTISTQRKVIRDPNIINLSSNINYFNGLTLPMQSFFQYPSFQLQVQKPQQNIQIKRKTIRPLKSLETLQEKNIQESTIKDDTVGQQIKRVEQQNQQQKQDKYVKQNEKQSMNGLTLQKLKKVQKDIDQLLAKASKTRAMILR